MKELLENGKPIHTSDKTENLNSTQMNNNNYEFNYFSNLATIKDLFNIITDFLPIEDLPNLYLINKYFYSNDRSYYITRINKTLYRWLPDSTMVKFHQLYTTLENLLIIFNDPLTQKQVSAILNNPKDFKKNDEFYKKRISIKKGFTVLKYFQNDSKFKLIYERLKAIQENIIELKDNKNPTSKFNEIISQLNFEMKFFWQTIFNILNTERKETIKCIEKISYYDARRLENCYEQEVEKLKEDIKKQKEELQNAIKKQEEINQNKEEKKEGQSERKNRGLKWNLRRTTAIAKKIIDIRKIEDEIINWWNLKFNEVIKNIFFRFTDYSLIKDSKFQLISDDHRREDKKLSDIRINFINEIFIKKEPNFFFLKHGIKFEDIVDSYLTEVRHSFNFSFILFIARECDQTCLDMLYEKRELIIKFYFDIYSVSENRECLTVKGGRGLIQELFFSITFKQDNKISDDLNKIDSLSYYDKYGRSLLDIAAFVGIDTDLFQKLLNKMEKPSITRLFEVSFEKYAPKPLSEYSDKEFYIFAKSLYEKCPITPLAVACFAGHKGIAELLILYLPSLNKEVYLLEALYWAFKSHQLDIMKWLLENGAPLTLHNNLNSHLLYLALCEDDRETFHLLLYSARQDGKLLTISQKIKLVTDLRLIITSQLSLETNIRVENVLARVENLIPRASSPGNSEQTVIQNGSTPPTSTTTLNNIIVEKVLAILRKELGLLINLLHEKPNSSIASSRTHILDLNIGGEPDKIKVQPGASTSSPPLLSPSDAGTSDPTQIKVQDASQPQPTNTESENIVSASFFQQHKKVIISIVVLSLLVAGILTAWLGFGLSLTSLSIYLSCSALAGGFVAVPIIKTSEKNEGSVISALNKSSSQMPIYAMQPEVSVSQTQQQSGKFHLLSALHHIEGGTTPTPFKPVPTINTMIEEQESKPEHQFHEAPTLGG